MAGNNPQLLAIREAVDGLKQAPLFDRAEHAVNAVGLTLAYLETLDRRVSDIERELQGSLDPAPGRA